MTLDIKSLEDLYQLFLASSGVSTDSRKVEAGTIFFALKGSNFNGNKYALEALEKGAMAAVVDDPSLAGDDPRLIWVSDTLKALQLLAKLHRQRLAPIVIALTGTNGKTTTKELIKAVLSKEYQVCATEGNLNNHIGVPLTLLKLQKQDQIAIIEMGANKPGDIQELVEIALPDYGLITNIGTAHLEGFGSLDGVAKTKGELYSYLKRNQGIVFLNGSDELLRDMAIGLVSVTYGLAEDLPLVRGELLGENSFKVGVSWQYKDRLRNVRTNLVGRYNLNNLLAAITIGLYFDVSDGKIVEALESYTPSNSRSQLIERGERLIVLDAYNANPTSMAEALSNLYQNATPDRPRVLILGDMNELGDQSIALHQALYSSLQSYLRAEDKVFLVGPIWSSLRPNESYPSVSALIESAALDVIPSRALILVKGSNSINLSKLKELL